MPDARPKLAGGDELEPWEKYLIESVAARYDTLEREDLAAELAWRLLVLKRRRRPEIRNWRAYVSKFLRNKASNWIRKTRPRERSTISLDAPIMAGDETGETLADILCAPESAADRQLALKDALDALPSDLRTLLRIIIEENWNQTLVARRLRKHRNTIRAWIRRIQQTLIAYGFSPGLDVEKTPANSPAKVSSTKSILKGRDLITISRALLDALINLRLNGTQWRLALWVIGRTSVRKQKVVPFSWRGVARTLAMDHAGIGRAGLQLLRCGLVYSDGERIGFERSVHRWRIEGARLSRQGSPRGGERKHRF